jgi:hypothetical protein
MTEAKTYIFDFGNLPLSGNPSAWDHEGNKQMDGVVKSVVLCKEGHRVPYSWQQQVQDLLHSFGDAEIVRVVPSSMQVEFDFGQRPGPLEVRCDAAKNGNQR